MSSGSPVVLAVSPRANSMEVSTTLSVTITFDRRMMAGTENLILLHKGTIVGPEVAGTAVWSSDHTALTFRPNEQLLPKRATHFTCRPT